ncbi:MAG TPA: hypothetical protein VE242_03540 [Chthoniobacterales bacterium]|nr:hypothetical protein [Chthoniobacterales bacterium]
MFSKRAAHFANEREVLGEKRAPIANFEMSPNSEPLVEQEPVIHRPRQQAAHILARWRDCLDQGN